MPEAATFKNGVFAVSGGSALATVEMTTTTGASRGGRERRRTTRIGEYETPGEFQFVVLGLMVIWIPLVCSKR